MRTLLPAIPRRLLPLLATTPVLAQPAIPADYRWRVLRNGTHIGSHDVTFTRRGEELLALSEVMVAPRVLGVVVYRFEHRYTEVTRGGRFVSVTSRLNRNGRIVEVHPRRLFEVVRRQERQQVAHVVQAALIVGRDELGHARLRGVDPGAAQILLGDVLAGHLLHHVGAEPGRLGEPGPVGRHRGRVVTDVVAQIER